MNERGSQPDPAAYTEGFLKEDYDAVLKLLEQEPEQAQVVFGNLATTLLHAAAYDGQLAIVQQLITLDADLNAKEINGRTPLHHAANNGHLKVIEVLVRAGADMEIRDVEDMTPLMWGKISRSGRKKEIVAKLLLLGAKE